MKDNKWVRLLAYVTGLVNQELLLQNEYLAAENRILRAYLPARLRLSDPERSTLAAIGKRLGRNALAPVPGLRRQTRHHSVEGCGQSDQRSLFIMNKPRTLAFNRYIEAAVMCVCSNCGDDSFSAARHRFGP